MKNYQKGFIVPALIAVIALLVIGGGVYIYESKKIEAPVIDNNVQQTDQAQQSTGVQNAPVTTQTNNPSSQADTSNWKTATNIAFGFSFKYPSNWFVDDNLTVNTCCLNITSYNTGTERLFAGQTQIQVQRYTKSATQSLTAFASLPDEQTGKSPKVQVVVVAGLQGVKSDALGDGIYYLPKSETEGLRVISWSHPDTRQASQTFTQQILSTFKFTKTDSVSTSKPIKNTICTLSGNSIDDGQNQNGLTFVAEGQSCVTLSGWKPNSQDKVSLTPNGATKTWQYVLLSFYQAHFSPDGKHFAYTASNIPLPAPTGGDWKPQRFVVHSRCLKRGQTNGTKDNYDYRGHPSEAGCQTEPIVVGKFDDFRRNGQ